ncbi:MAG: hypothetical protein JSV88_07220 [Candidatus Aminicenantes bacterium]|nr:MAG: hypothetical protein JSV88_07220 [Candidatus Aminicenantes bacterium]
MKKTNLKMKKIHNQFAGDFGIRFLLFRKAIKKTRLQMASELGIGQQKIAAVEKGTTYPKIDYLHYLNKKYGLNINWMVSGMGDMFVKDRPPDVDSNYAAKSPAQPDLSLDEKTIELMQLMQIPSVEKVIMAKLKEIKERLREEA